MESVASWSKKHWEWGALIGVTLAVRLYLLRVYDIELSEDGFDAVKTLGTLQAHGFAGLSTEELTRLVLHPLYTLWLYVFRLAVPASIDFYVAARFLSTAVGAVAVVLLFEFVKKEYGSTAAWIAALLLAFAPSFLWESVAILSSTLFLVFYLAVVTEVAASRYRAASVFALLAAITRAEGIALVALVFIALLVQSMRDRKWPRPAWAALVVCAALVPLTILGSSLLASGNPLAFLGAQSISTIWLRFLAPGDYASRALFFITQYPALVPLPVVLLGLAGAVAALAWHRGRATFLLIGLALLYVAFFETLVWFNYTTLEVRFLMYPGLPLLVFAGVALAEARNVIVSFGARGPAAGSRDTFLPSQSPLDAKPTVRPTPNTPSPLFPANGEEGEEEKIWGDTPPAPRSGALPLNPEEGSETRMTRASVGTEHQGAGRGASANPSPVPTGSVVKGVARWRIEGLRVAATAGLVGIVAVLLAMSYAQGNAGMRFLYNMMASQREMAEALTQFIPPGQPTNLMVYTGNAGALDLFGRQRGLELAFTDFRFAPDDAPEQFLIDRRIQFVVYPVGNAFAKAKYPYLAQFQAQSHGGVTFRPLLQFATSADNQLYSIWAVAY